MGQTCMNSWNYHGNKPHIFLKPGELCVSKKPVVVTTVLGSCVSVTLFHQLSGLSAICHVLQPKCHHPNLCVTECKMQYRYAECTIKKMSQRFLAFKLNPAKIEVKLFGGGALISHQQNKTFANSIGQQNVKTAIDTLNECGLILKVMDVGGTFGRKIIFDTSSGEVFMKRLHRMNMSDTGS
jgi:chemotaxis protein CheD